MLNAKMKVSDSFLQRILRGENPIRDGYVCGNIEVLFDRNTHKITFVVRDSGGILAACGPIDIYDTTQLTGISVRLSVDMVVTMSLHRSWTTKPTLHMIKLVLNQQLVVLKRMFSNLEKTILMLQETINSF